MPLLIVYQISWACWFALFVEAVPHLAYRHTQAGAIAWTAIYSAYAVLIIVRDSKSIPQSYFLIILALADITIALCVLTMVCNTLRDRGKFWSSNMLELASIGWISAQIVKGVVLSSGAPILIATALVRFVQDGVKKEAALWIVCTLVESFVTDVLALYLSMAGLILIAFCYIYRHNVAMVLLSPIIAVAVAGRLLWALRKQSWTLAVQNTKMDGMQLYLSYGAYFVQLPTRADDVPPISTHPWW